MDFAAPFKVQRGDRMARFVPVSRRGLLPLCGAVYSRFAAGFNPALRRDSFPLCGITAGPQRVFPGILELETPIFMQKWSFTCVEIIPAQDFFQNLGEFLNFPDGSRA